MSGASDATAPMPSEGANWSSARGEQVDLAVGSLVVRARVDVCGRHHRLSVDAPPLRAVDAAFGSAKAAVDVACAAVGHPAAVGRAVLVAFTAHPWPGPWQRRRLPSSSRACGGLTEPLSRPLLVGTHRAPGPALRDQGSPLACGLPRSAVLGLRWW